MQNQYLTPRRVEFIVTNLCNGSCAHCYASKQEEGYTKHIDASLAVEIIEKIASRFDVESVMTFGGEPMLFPEAVYAIHKTAASKEVSSRELITNGYWSNNNQSTRKKAEKLAESGVNQIYFSVDAFHQEHIPLDVVRNAITSCIEVGIEDLALNPCWLVSEKDDNKYNRRTKAILQELASLPVRISDGNLVEPAGEAIKNLSEFLPSKFKMLACKCGDLPYTEPLDQLTSFSVEPDGKISVCEGLSIGDASQEDILNLIDEYDPFEMRETREIIENGLIGLSNYARSKGVEPDPDGYYSVCQMCYDLRRRLKNQLRY